MYKTFHYITEIIRNRCSGSFLIIKVKSCDVYGSSSALWVKWHRTGLVSAKHVFLSSFSFKANWIRVLFFIILTLQYFHTKPIETSDLSCLP